MKQGHPSMSVVIPFYNEEENVQQVVDELIPVLKSMDSPFEVILIDDGSIDQSYECMLNVQNRYPQIRVVKLSRNMGQTAAFLCGFEQAKGEVIVTMDGDYQNDPHDIPLLVTHLDTHDLVCGWRQKRNDSTWRRLQSTIANTIRDRVLKDGIKDTGCSLKAFKKKPTTRFFPFDGMHRFIPILLKQQGYRITQIPVNHRQRVAGQTKYGLKNRMLRSFLDMLAVRWIGNRLLRIQIERHDVG